MILWGFRVKTLATVIKITVFFNIMTYMQHLKSDQQYKYFCMPIRTVIESERYYIITTILTNEG